MPQKENNKIPKLKLISIILESLFLLVGFCAVVYGIFAIYAPAAFIAGGVLLLIAGQPKRKKVNKEQ